MVDKLLMAGASAGLQDYRGCNALHSAAQGGHSSVFARLHEVTSCSHTVPFCPGPALAQSIALRTCVLAMGRSCLVTDLPEARQTSLEATSLHWRYLVFFAWGCALGGVWR